MVDIQAISTGLQLADDGIWYSTDSQNLSYPFDGNRNARILEDNSFWFQHRNSCIASIVKSYPPKDDGVIFDIGGGNGFVSLELTNAGFNVVLVEPGIAGASNAKRRGIKDVICATTETARFKQKSLSAVGLFDVLEHIENDVSFLQSIRALIRDGGHLYMTVPAFSFLWSREDVLAGHFRRYTLASISSNLKSSGFDVIFSSYIFRLLPIPIFLFRSLPYKLGLSKEDRELATVSRDHAVNGGVAAKVLNLTLPSEISNLDDQRGMHFGGSCLVVAKSP